MVLRRIPRLLLGRAKGGQTTWSPNRGPTSLVGGSLPNVLSAHETTRLVYRPLPRDYTVEYEEDYGNCVAIYREYVSPRAREATSNIHGLGHSKTEMNDLRRQFAAEMNDVRNATARTTTPRNAVPFQVSSIANDAPGQVQAPSFTFDDDRIKYVERFERHMGNGLRALAEACAVLYGVDDVPAREGWYSQFLGLDASQLESERDALVEAQAAAQDLEEAMNGKPSSASDAEEEEAGDEGGASREAAFHLPVEQAAFAPLYLNYKAYCEGRAPAVFPGALRQTAGKVDHCGRRHQWRSIMDKLVNEQYHTLTPAEIEEARVLNGQLHTSRLLGAKVDQMVSEQAAYAKAIDGVTSAQLGTTSNPTIADHNPERRDKMEPEPRVPPHQRHTTPS